jgi:hypothetical protein
MIEKLIGVAAVVVLFVLFGWLQWNRPHRGCGNCACGGETCEQTGERRPLHLMESSDGRH